MNAGCVTHYYVSRIHLLSLSFSFRDLIFFVGAYDNPTREPDF